MLSQEEFDGSLNLQDHSWLNLQDSNIAQILERRTHHHHSRTVEPSGQLALQLIEYQSYSTCSIISVKVISF